jgi:hypothetical protein
MSLTPQKMAIVTHGRPLVMVFINLIINLRCRFVLWIIISGYSMVIPWQPRSHQKRPKTDSPTPSSASPSPSSLGLSCGLSKPPRLTI